MQKVKLKTKFIIMECTFISCVAWVPIPGDWVHKPVPGTRTGYLGTSMVRPQPYPAVPKSNLTYQVLHV